MLYSCATWVALSLTPGGAGTQEDRDDTLDAECVRENEVQTEAQAEEEAAQEEQRMSMFARDDEQPNPWPCDALGKVPLLCQISGVVLSLFCTFPYSQPG